MELCGSPPYGSRGRADLVDSGHIDLRVSARRCGAPAGALRKLGRGRRCAGRCLAALSFNVAAVWRHSMQCTNPRMAVDPHLARTSFGCCAMAPAASRPRTRRPVSLGPGLGLVGARMGNRPRLQARRRLRDAPLPLSVGPRFQLETIVLVSSELHSGSCGVACTAIHVWRTTASRACHSTCTSSTAAWRRPWSRAVVRLSRWSVG